MNFIIETLLRIKLIPWKHIATYGPKEIRTGSVVFERYCFWKWSRIVSNKGIDSITIRGKETVFIPGSYKKTIHD